MNFFASVDFARARQKLWFTEVGVMREIPDLLRQEARLAAVSMCMSTAPFDASEGVEGFRGNYTGAVARKLGRTAVRRDIYRIYATPGMVFKTIAANSGLLTVADEFLAAMSGGAMRGRGKKRALRREEALTIARGILKRYGGKYANTPIGPFDGGLCHTESRNGRGRVPESQAPRLIVTDPGQLKAYVEKEQDLVGYGKSAWAGMARALGSIRGIAAGKTSAGNKDITGNWILRHHAPFTIRQSGGGDEQILQLRSLVRYAGMALQPNGKYFAVMGARDRMAKQIRAAARAAARKLEASV